MPKASPICLVHAVRGAVVDVRFGNGVAPALNTAFVVDRDRPGAPKQGAECPTMQSPSP